MGLAVAKTRCPQGSGCSASPLPRRRRLSGRSAPFAPAPRFDTASQRPTSAAQHSVCGRSCIYVQLFMNASLRSARCLVAPHSQLALQATICIEQCAQTTRRPERLRMFRSGSDLGGPFARRADHSKRHLSTHASTAFRQGGDRRYPCAGSRLNASLTVSQTKSCVFAQAARTPWQRPEQGRGDTQPQARDGRWDVPLRALGCREACNAWVG